MDRVHLDDGPTAMDYLDDLFSRFTSRDPGLLAAIASDRSTAAGLARLLRMTPLATLARHRAALVDALRAVPELQAPLRAGWVRQDPWLTAQIFSWVTQAELAATRTDGGSWDRARFMRDGELVAA